MFGTMSCVNKTVATSVETNENCEAGFKLPLVHKTKTEKFKKNATPDPLEIISSLLVYEGEG